MLLSRTQRRLINRRANELCREVGTLLLAFAPLDYFQQEHVDVAMLATFLTIGIVLVALGLIGELRGVR